MERVEILRALTTDAAAMPDERLAELAVTLDVPFADLLVIAGRPVPEALLPPPRDPKALQTFAYRASHCGHTQLLELASRLPLLPRTDSEPKSPPMPGSRIPEVRPDAGPFALVFAGLLRNRGFGWRELPFTGLSLSTILGALRQDRIGEHRPFRLAKLAGPLGWRVPDLFAVAGEPWVASERTVPMHCHHLGRALIAAIPLTTGQLLHAADLACRLGTRHDHGAWQPFSRGFATDCPELDFR